MAGDTRRAGYAGRYAAMLTFGSLFSGIGGFDLGLERAGMKCLWQVEIDDYCQRVLAKHWPDIPKYGDITKVEWSNVEKVEVIAGGFPCQPVSTANPNRKKQKDPRWLWPEYARAIRALRPKYALVENVTGLFSGGFDEVLADLAACGYYAEWQVLPASAFGAFHKRERVFVVAYSHGVRMERSTAQQIFGEQIISGGQDCQPFQVIRERFDSPTSRLCRSLHGIPFGVDRVRALGNAIVPQVAEYIGQIVVRHNTRVQANLLRYATQIA